MTKREIAAREQARDIAVSMLRRELDHLRSVEANERETSARGNKSVPGRPLAGKLISDAVGELATALTAKIAEIEGRPVTEWLL